MGYSKDVYDDALAELEKRRNNAERENAIVREEFFRKYPRAHEIEQSLAQTGVMAARMVFSDKSDVRTALERMKQQNMKLQAELREILAKDRRPADYLEVHYSCSECKDTGYIDGRMCRCFKSLLREKAYDKLNNSSPLSLSDFKSFSLEYYSRTPQEGRSFSPYSRMEKVLDFCKKYAESFLPKTADSLLFQGGPGLGKTHLSLAIARAVIAKGYGVIYVSAPDVLSKLEKERFGSYGDGRSDETETLLKECDLLILDDLGTEFTTQFTAAAIYNIVNTRMMTNKPTIISTNLSLSQLQKLYTMRMVSRIIGGMQRIEFFGEDIRQQKYSKLRKGR